MKEIEFRGLYRGHIWLYGDYMENEGKHFIRNKRVFEWPESHSVKIKPFDTKTKRKIKQPTLAFVEVEKDSVGMYFGRSDMMQNRLYTGDIVEVDGVEYEIIYRDDTTQFILLQVGNYETWDVIELPENSQMRKIGTIYDDQIKSRIEAIKS